MAASRQTRGGEQRDLHFDGADRDAFVAAEVHIGLAGWPAAACSQLRRHRCTQHGAGGKGGQHVVLLAATRGGRPYKGLDGLRRGDL